jgi:hypothetical protein
MPYFSVTPRTKGKPIVCQGIDIDGTTYKTITNLPEGAAPTHAAVVAFANAKFLLSNLGLYSVAGAGSISSIAKVLAEAADELYSAGYVMRVEFVNESDPNLKLYDRIPAIDAGRCNGYALDETDTDVQAYIAAAEALFSVGGATGLDDYIYSGSVIEGLDVARSFPIVSDPGGEEGEPA